MTFIMTAVKCYGNLQIKGPFLTTILIDSDLHRYFVKVSSDLVGTVQFQTSTAHVHIRLSILDQEVVVASNTGKGHVIIPVFCFLSNQGESHGGGGGGGGGVSLYLL